MQEMKIFKYYVLKYQNEAASGIPYYYRGEQIKLGDRFVLLDGITKYHSACYERNWVRNIKSFLEEVGNEQWFEFDTHVVYIGECECPEETENPEDLHDFYTIDSNIGTGRNPNQDTIIRKEADEPIEIETDDFLPREAFTDEWRFFNGVKIKPNDKFEILFGGRDEESSIVVEVDVLVNEEGEVVGLDEADGYYYTFGSSLGDFMVHSRVLDAFECKYRLVE